MAREFNQATLQALAMSASQRANAVNIYDTIASCWTSRKRGGTKEYTQRYIEGKYPPHYPVPATLGEVYIGDNCVVIYYTTPARKSKYGCCVTGYGWEAND